MIANGAQIYQSAADVVQHLRAGAGCPVPPAVNVELDPEAWVMMQHSVARAAR